MFSYFNVGLLVFTTLSYVLVSCRTSTAINGTNVEMIQVAGGRGFTLNCPVGITSNTSNEVHWFHEGRPLGGIEVVRVTRSNSSHGGYYVCSGAFGNKTMYVIIGNKTVEEGDVLELHCKGEKRNASHNQDIKWTKNGNVLTKWTGINTLNMSNAQLNDGGVYICNNSGNVSQTNVVVGKIPSLPPEPECLNSSDTVIQCIAYPGEFLDANKICITVKSVGRWGTRYSGCHSCFTGNETVKCYLDFNDQWLTSYEITTEVENYVTSSRRTVEYENLQKKVIPDQPTVVNMTATGVDSFTTWFRIPKTWDERTKYFARGLYTQNGGETHIVNVPPEDKYNSYKGQYGMFQFNTEESLAYSLVCWQIQIRFDYGFKNTTWSSPSERVCEYTFMAAPSEKPEELIATFEQDNESPEHRNVTFSWKPPLEQYRNGIIDHYQLVLNRGPSKEDAVRNETIPGNVSNITFSGIESYETFSAKLTAWTQIGQSPPQHVVIDPIPRPNKAFRRMLVIAITLTAIIFLIMFGRITWITRRKISADHLPEPYFIPEEKMQESLAKKCFLPRQKEVFDVLKGKAEESSRDICDNHDSSYNACTIPSLEAETPFVSCSSTGSEVSEDPSYKSSSGASCYILVSSTDSAIGTDGTVGSESKSSTNDHGQNYKETEIDGTNEVDHPKAITEKNIYGELGCYDGREDICYENRQYVNCNSGVPQGEWGSKGQRLQLCNDTENPGYNITATRGGDELDPNYNNYTSFKFRVHDTMTKLNGHKEVV